MHHLEYLRKLKRRKEYYALLFLSCAAGFILNWVFLRSRPECSVYGLFLGMGFGYNLKCFEYYRKVYRETISRDQGD